MTWDRRGPSLTYRTVRLRRSLRRTTFVNRSRYDASAGAETCDSGMRGLVERRVADVVQHQATLFRDVPDEECGAAAS